MREPSLEVFVKPFGVSGEQGFCGGLDGEVERGELSARLWVGQVEIEAA